MSTLFTTANRKGIRKYQVTISLLFIVSMLLMATLVPQKALAGGIGDVVTEVTNANFSATDFEFSAEDATGLNIKMHMGGGDFHSGCGGITVLGPADAAGMQAMLDYVDSQANHTSIQTKKLSGCEVREYTMSNGVGVGVVLPDYFITVELYESGQGNASDFQTAVSIAQQVLNGLERNGLLSSAAPDIEAAETDEEETEASPEAAPGVTGKPLDEPIAVSNTMNIAGVYNGPTAPTIFNISSPHLVTYILTYHWNNAQGATPGTIALQDNNGTVYGPWQVTSRPGQGGVPNAYWEVTPNIVIPAGTYTVIDSDPATWAQNAESGGRGMGEVRATPHFEATSGSVDDMAPGSTPYENGCTESPAGVGSVGNIPGPSNTTEAVVGVAVPGLIATGLGALAGLGGGGGFAPPGGGPLTSGGSGPAGSPGGSYPGASQQGSESAQAVNQLGRRRRGSEPGVIPDEPHSSPPGKDNSGIVSVAEEKVPGQAGDSPGIFIDTVDMLDGSGALTPGAKSGGMLIDGVEESAVLNPSPAGIIIDTAAESAVLGEPGTIIDTGGEEAIIIHHEQMIPGSRGADAGILIDTSAFDPGAPMTVDSTPARGIVGTEPATPAAAAGHDSVAGMDQTAEGQPGAPGEAEYQPESSAPARETAAAEQESNAEEYDSTGYDANGFDREGYNQDGFDKEGFDRQGFDQSGYDREGYNQDGFNKEGFDKEGYNQAGFDAEGFDKEGFNQAGFDKEGFDRQGFDQSGYDREGFNRDGFDKAGFDREGFNKAGFDAEGFDKEGFNQAGFDKEGFDRQGFDQSGYDREGFNQDGFDKAGFDREGFNKAGFDAEGFDKEGFNQAGFDKEGFDRQGFDQSGYDREGFNQDGFDKAGFDREGFNKAGFDAEGFDKEGFNQAGFDRDGYGRNGFDAEGFDREGYDVNGYDRKGYSRSGFDAKGYDKQGYDREGFNKDGWDREGYDREGFDKNGWDREGYDKEGFDKDGYNREGYDREGKSSEGYDADGYDKHGFNEHGYDRDGYDREGFDFEGYNHDGYDPWGYNKQGYGKDGYHWSGYNRDGYNRAGMHWTDNPYEGDSPFNVRTGTNPFDEDLVVDLGGHSPADSWEPTKPPLGEPYPRTVEKYGAKPWTDEIPAAEPEKPTVPSTEDTGVIGPEDPMNTLKNHDVGTGDTTSPPEESSMPNNIPEEEWPEQSGDIPGDVQTGDSNTFTYTDPATGETSTYEYEPGYTGPRHGDRQILVGKGDGQTYEIEFNAVKGKWINTESGNEFDPGDFERWQNDVSEDKRRAAIDLEKMAKREDATSKAIKQNMEDWHQLEQMQKAADKYNIGQPGGPGDVDKAIEQLKQDMLNGKELDREKLDKIRRVIDHRIQGKTTADTGYRYEEDWFSNLGWALEANAATAKEVLTGEKADGSVSYLGIAARIMITAATAGLAGGTSLTFTVMDGALNIAEAMYRIQDEIAKGGSDFRAVSKGIGIFILGEEAGWLMGKAGGKLMGEMLERFPAFTNKAADMIEAALLKGSAKNQMWSKTVGLVSKESAEESLDQINKRLVDVGSGEAAENIIKKARGDYGLSVADSFDDVSKGGKAFTGSGDDIFKGAGKSASTSSDDISKGAGKSASASSDDISKGAGKSASASSDDISKGAGKSASASSDDISKGAGKTSPGSRDNMTGGGGKATSGGDDMAGRRGGSAGDAPQAPDGPGKTSSGGGDGPGGPKKPDGPDGAGKAASGGPDGPDGPKKTSASGAEDGADGTGKATGPEEGAVKKGPVTSSIPQVNDYYAQAGKQAEMDGYAHINMDVQRVRETMSTNHLAVGESGAVYAAPPKAGVPAYEFTNTTTVRISDQNLVEVRVRPGPGGQTRYVTPAGEPIDPVNFKDKIFMTPAPEGTGMVLTYCDPQGIMRTYIPAKFFERWSDAVNGFVPMG